MEKFPNCVVCFGDIADPKYLNCGHPICTTCVEKNRKFNSSLSCQICKIKRPTQMAPGRPSSDPSQDQNSPKKPPTTIRQLISEVDDDLKEWKEEEMCTIHTHLNLTLFCNYCGKVICKGTTICSTFFLIFMD